MPHSEEHPEPWPDIPVVTEKWHIRFSQIDNSEAGSHHPITGWVCTYPTTHSLNGRGRAFLNNVTDNGDGTLTGELMTLRYGGGDVGDLRCQAIARKPYPEDMNMMQMVTTWPQEQLEAFEAEHAPVYSSDSNGFPMPTAIEFTPEVGIGIGLILGVLGLVYACRRWPLKTR